MKIVFKRLIITDLKEKVSRKIVFEPKRNLLASESNGKGKSIIMKSLYHSLGANAEFDANIDKKTIIFDMTLSYGEDEYRIIRFVDQYLVLKNHKLDLSCQYGAISELAEYYKKEFGMYVYLKDRNGGLPIAPPAYSFIPYYLDQDLSWKKAQMPFDKLGQYEKISLNDLYYYHLAVYNEEYSDTKSKYKEQQVLYNNLISELHQEQKIYQQLKENINVGSVCVDETEVSVLIESLSTQINKMFLLYNKVKNELYSLENERADCFCQVENIGKCIKNIDAQMRNPKTKVKCPECGSEFEVDLEQEMRKLYNKTFLQKRKEYYITRIKEIESQIQGKRKEMDESVSKINKLEAQLKNEQVNFEAYTRRKIADSLFRTLLVKISQINDRLMQYKSEIEKLKKVLDSFEIRTKNIKEYFKRCYIENLIQLNVKRFNSDRIKPFEKLAIGGSQYVRSTLAFFYSFLEVKKKFNKEGFRCPLVIDSPREGEQDDMNSRNIINFIFSKYDEEEQLIVASVNGDKFVDKTEKYNNIHIIKLENDDNQVMTTQGYQENMDEINEVKFYLGLK